MTLFENIFEDLMKLGVLVGFALVVYSGFAKKPIKQVLLDLKELFSGKEEER